ncbi:hypothetical protein L9F63_022873, partial [Diploptera punctata]
INIDFTPRTSVILKFLTHRGSNTRRFRLVMYYFNHLHYDVLRIITEHIKQLKSSNKHYNQWLYDILSAYRVGVYPNQVLKSVKVEFQHIYVIAVDCYFCMVPPALVGILKLTSALYLHQEHRRYDGSGIDTAARRLDDPVLQYPSSNRTSLSSITRFQNTAARQACFPLPTSKYRCSCLKTNNINIERSTTGFISIQLSVNDDCRLNSVLPTSKNILPVTYRFLCNALGPCHWHEERKRSRVVNVTKFFNLNSSIYNI